MSVAVARRRQAFAASAALGVALGVGVVTLAYGDGTAYLFDDPGACANCHVMREAYDGWAHGGHRHVATCNDCHVPQDVVGKYWTKAVHGWRHSKGFTLDDFEEPIRAKPDSQRVVRENCVRCHTPVVGDVLALDPGPRPAHLPAATAGLDCVACHRHVAHGPR